MTKELPTNKKDEQNWDEVLPKGDLEMIALNTMIPRKLSNAVSECTGWLQLASPRLRYTKQATVQYLLERGIQALHEDIENENNHASEIPENTSIYVVEDGKMINIIKAGKKEINFKDYETFANKHSGGYRYGR